MATKLYIRDNNIEGGVTGTDINEDLSHDRGSVATDFVKNTVAGPVTPPTAATQFTETAGSTVVTWSSPEIVSGFTLAGNVTFNVWVKESSGSANASIIAEVYRLDATGAVVSTAVSDIGQLNPEAGTSYSALNWSGTAATPNIVFSAGDRIGLRIFIDDGTGFFGIPQTMAAGSTVSISVDGPNSGSSGDSYIQLTETVNLAYEIFPSETVTLSEALATKFVGISIPVESLVLSDSAPSKFRGISTLSSTVAISEQVNKLFTARVTLFETVVLNEALLTKFVGKSLPAETVALIDSALYSAGYKNAVSDTNPISDSGALKHATSQTISESVALSGVASQKLASTVALPETLNISELLSVKLNPKVSLNEVVSLNEALNILGAAKVTLSESLAISESITARRATVNNLSEAISISEGELSKYSVAVALTNTIAIVEVLVVAKGNAFIFDYVIPFAESITTKFVGDPITNETIALTDSLVQKVNTHVSLSESISISESIAFGFVARVNFSQLVDLAYEIKIGGTAHASNYVTVTEQVALLEVLLSKLRSNIPITQTVSLSEIMVALRKTLAVQAELVALSEAKIDKQSAISALIESLVLNELMQVRVAHIVPVAGFNSVNIQNVVPLSEGLNTVYKNATALTSSVALVEFILSKFRLVSALNEVIGVSESLQTIVRNNRVSIQESVAISDVVVSNWKTRAIFDVLVDLAYDVDTIYGQHVSVSDVAMPVSDSALALARHFIVGGEVVAFSDLLLAKARYSTALSQVNTLSESMAALFKNIIVLNEAVGLNGIIGQTHLSTQVFSSTLIFLENFVVTSTAPPVVVHTLPRTLYLGLPSAGQQRNANRIIKVEG